MLGEKLTFEGRWLGIPVGFGTLEVDGIVEIDGRRAYHIRGYGSTNEVLSKLYPIQDALESYLDVETLKPLRFEKKQREGRYRAEEVVIFDHAKGVAHYESKLNGSKKDVPLTEAVQDIISAFYWLRRQPAAPNTLREVSIYSDEKTYNTEIRIGRIESIELLRLGTFEALVVEPKASFKGVLVKRGRIWAYVTADAMRLPLMIKATTPWGPMSAVLQPESMARAESLWKNADRCSAGP